MEKLPYEEALESWALADWPGRHWEAHAENCHLTATWGSGTLGDCEVLA